MVDFFEGVAPELAEEIQNLSRLTYQLRENRKAILDGYGVADEATLLECIRTGSATEHPGYEHYLAARILDGTREAVRSALAERLVDARA
ncbi:MAG: hypothetical protein BGP21_07790 [Thiobacillus sp. 65-29]|nr:MAG: hypothetical protein BGP21_07790 [Thiobacillus sp. 65-29]